MNAYSAATDVSPPEFNLSLMGTGPDSSQDASLATHEMVACRAFELYEQSGCAAGRCAQNWAQAEYDLNKRMKGGV